ncbi:MAG: Fic family protein [Nanobdellota archaeon]
MVSFRKKNIKDREYLYAEYSFRLPDNRVKKISKRVKEKDDSAERYFLEKEIEEHIKFALKNYTTDPVLTENKIKKLEDIKIRYKHIIKRLTEKQWKHLLERFTINFTYESNALEGNSLTLKDVTLILHENIVPKDKELREIYETKNTKEAHDLLFNKRLKITKESILRLQKMTMKNTGVKPGFKKVPNYLLMRNVKTTPPEKVEEEIEDLIDWYQNNKGKIHPVALASGFHGRFEKIHPFEDGNGRVGRTLINAILTEHGYPPLIIRKTMRPSYFSALEAYDNEHKEKLERFLLKKIEDTFNKFFKEYERYL